MPPAGRIENCSMANKLHWHDQGWKQHTDCSWAVSLALRKTSPSELSKQRRHYCSDRELAVMWSYSCLPVSYWVADATSWHLNILSHACCLHSRTDTPRLNMYIWQELLWCWLHHPTASISPNLALPDDIPPTSPSLHPPPPHLISLSISHLLPPPLSYLLEGNMHHVASLLVWSPQPLHHCHFCQSQFIIFTHFSPSLLLHPSIHPALSCCLFFFAYLLRGRCDLRQS